MAPTGPRPCTSPDIPACLLDPLSVHGLRRLQREQPDRWAIIVADHLPDLLTLTTDMSVGTALRGAVLDWDAMQRLGPSAFRRHRQSCSAAAKAAGRIKLGDIDDAALMEIRGKLVRQRVSSETTSRTLTILRKLARSYAEETGSEPLVTSNPTKVVAARAFQKATSRPLWSPEEVSRLLAVTRDCGARVAAALAVGCGLTPIEVLHVAAADFDLKKHLLVVHGLDRSDAPRVMPLPAFVEDLLRDYIAAYARQGRPQSPWLFPGPRDPRQPRGDFTRLLQAAHARSGGLGHHPPVTLRDLRRTFQWAILRAGMPRECVRGTWSMTSGEWPPWWPALQKLVRSEWRSLTGLDRERWPRGCTSFVRSYDGLMPMDVVDARKKLHCEPPPLPSSSAGAP
jgi:integrase